MWEKVIIPMYRLWLHGLYGLYGPRCLLVVKFNSSLTDLFLPSDGIVKYMRTKAGPSSKDLTSHAELLKFIDNEEHSIVGR